MRIRVGWRSFRRKNSVLKSAGREGLAPCRDCALDHTNNGLISEAPECNHIIVLKPGPTIGMVDNILVEGNVAVVL
jgi:hypothetical protein